MSMEPESACVEDVTFLPQGLPYVPQVPLLLSTAHASSTGGTRQKRGTFFLPGKQLKWDRGQDRLGGRASALQMCG